MLIYVFICVVWVEEKNIVEDGVICECLVVVGFDFVLVESGFLEGVEIYV